MAETVKHGRIYMNYTYKVKHGRRVYYVKSDLDLTYCQKSLKHISVGMSRKCITLVSGSCAIETTQCQKDM